MRIPTSDATVGNEKATMINPQRSLSIVDFVDDRIVEEDTEE